MKSKYCNSKVKQCRITEYRDPDGVRFTKLHRYMDADFVKENPYIYLSVDGDDLIFQITALFITDIGFDYIDPNPMGSKLTEFFQTVKKKN